MSKTFAQLGLPDAVVAALAKRGLTTAFPIQELALPPALAGKDVSGRAPTGSGKTLAFGIPMAERVTRAKPNRPTGLVLTPTRELAAQIRDEMEPLLAPNGRKVASFYGGVSFGPQLKALRRGVDVAVACPGRLLDLVRRGNLNLSDVQVVVLDEADRMSDMGFLPEVKKILDQVRDDRQTLLFSATLDGDIKEIVKRYQHDPVTCEIVPDNSHLDRTTHQFLLTKREDRVMKAAALATEHGSTVVFCRTKRGVDRVAVQLKRAGVNAVPIHGGRSQSQRDRALASFSRNEAKVLVATDVAARGIHVDNVRCVVHFDLPEDHKDYVHRSGRTGRAGQSGIVIALVTDADVGKARNLTRNLDFKIESDIGGGRSQGQGSSDRPRNSSRNGRSRYQGNRGKHSGDQRGRSNRKRSPGAKRSSGSNQTTGSPQRTSW
jgi:superfamily II DNA/RNA helicase